MSKNQGRGKQVRAAKMQGFGVVKWPANGEPFARKSHEPDATETKKNHSQEDEDMSFKQDLFAFLKKSIESDAPEATAEDQADDTATDVAAADAQDEDAPADAHKGFSPAQLAEIQSVVKGMLGDTVSKSDLAVVQKGITETQEGIMAIAGVMQQGFNDVGGTLKAMKGYRSAGNDQTPPAKPAVKSAPQGAAQGGGRQPAPVGADGQKPKASYKGTAFGAVATRYFGKN